MTILLFLAVVLTLACSSFCSGMETGFLSVRRERIIHMAREGSARAKIIYEAISNMGRTTTAILVGNNLANVCYSSAASALVATFYADVRSGMRPLDRDLAVPALAILFLGEFLPKLLCSARPLRRLLWLAPGWRVFARVFMPVGAAVQLVVERVLPNRETKTKMTPESVLKILKDRKDGVKLSDFESALIGRIMVLRARGEFVIPETLLSALDDAVV